MGVDMTRFTHRPVRAPGVPLEIVSVARLTEKKGLHVAIEACRQLKAQGVRFATAFWGLARGNVAAHAHRAVSVRGCH
ncbi:colanic acid biosynthesis glycosyltransferase WcaL [Salmonella enterica subsp. arizonae]|uniref:Colanic acid biosynthesis glycosyltransferase WcaL n=1 Tax=Salmonella enterica subsp. arizonae TaxID=59203 RepID=A0A2X4TMG7_SALER|nr:colanic acid biosynthesis glycosyltransferase WcaL [Salmonella enterica subsp. arizonae]